MNQVKKYYMKDLENITENWYRRDIVPFMKFEKDHELFFIELDYYKGLVYLDCCAVNELFASEDFYGDVLKYRKKMNL